MTEFLSRVTEALQARNQVVRVVLSPQGTRLAIHPWSGESASLLTPSPK